MQIYIVNKKTNKIESVASDIYAAETYIKIHNENEYQLLKDAYMKKLVSKTTYINDSVIYNNKDFYTSVNIDVIKEHFDEYNFRDIFGLKITKDRFLQEYYSNINRIAAVDGSAGEIEYNMKIGSEFISLFREECIKTDFSKESGISPMSIFAKLENIKIPNPDKSYMEVDVIDLVSLGCFREAAMALQYVEYDAFLTKERVNKYIQMLNSADIIKYATDKDYFYSV